MLVNRDRTVYLSFISTDLPVWSVIETRASLYQKEQDKFHLLLNQQNLPHSVAAENNFVTGKGLFWLEISPYRIMMTMQSDRQLSYRHYWEKGIYGTSRYYLNSDSALTTKSLRLSNYTRYLKVEGNLFPENIRLEYELRSQQVCLGTYILHLDIEH